MEKGNKLFHQLDRYVGIPIVLLLSILKIKKRKIPTGNIRSIAIVNLGSIGDNVIMSASISDLKKYFLDSEITVFSGSTNFQILQMIEGIDKIVKLHLTNIFKTISLIRKQGKFDICIDFGPWPRINAVVSFFVKSEFSVGFKAVKQHRHFLYDSFTIHSDQVHEIDNYRQMIKLLGISSESKPSIRVDRGKDFKDINFQKAIVIHPWPGGFKSYMKEWPTKNWIDLSAELMKSGFQIIITGAPADKEKSDKIFSSFEMREQKILNLAGKLSLSETIALIDKVKLVICVNTGITHITAALNIPMVVLHGPTSVKRWGPLSEKAISISPASSDCGYLNFGFEYHKSKVNCMELISVDEVIFSANKLLTNGTQ